MDHTAYLILKSCGPWQDPCHIIQLSAAVLSLCPWLRPAEERQTDRQGEEEKPPHLWVSLLPRKPCLAYLTPVSDDITCQDCPLTSKRLSSALSLNPETGHWWGGGVSQIMMTKNYWGRNTGMQFISAVNPQTGRAVFVFVYCECSLLVCLFSTSLCFVAGRWGSWAFWV